MSRKDTLKAAVLSGTYIALFFGGFGLTVPYLSPDPSPHGVFGPGWIDFVVGMGLLLAWLAYTELLGRLDEVSVSGTRRGDAGE